MSEVLRANVSNDLLRHTGIVNQPRLPYNPWREFKGTLSSCQRVNPSTIELNGEAEALGFEGQANKAAWVSFKGRDEHGASIWDHIDNGKCPQVLKVVRVKGNALCFDDLAGALADIGAAEVKFANEVHADVLRFPEPQAKAQSANCADVSWYPYAIQVDLQEDFAKSRVGSAPKTIKPPNDIYTPTRFNWYQTRSLWLVYRFPHGSMDHPDQVPSPATLEIWLDTGDSSVGVVSGGTSFGWVKWSDPKGQEPPTDLASALRKHLWGIKSSYVLVCVDTAGPNVGVVSEIIIP